MNAEMLSFVPSDEPEPYGSAETAGRIDVGRLWLPLSGWSVQVARGANDRPAIEVYAQGRLLDICVASDLGTALLRASYRRSGDERPWTLAWGRIPPGRPEIVAAFSGGRLPTHTSPVTVVARAFWVVEVPGAYREIAVSAGGDRVTGRPRRYRRS